MKENRKQETGNSGQRRALYGFLVGFLAFLVFVNSLKNDFVNFDDPGLILLKPSLTGLSKENLLSIFSLPIRGSYQPIRDFSYCLDFQLWGHEPMGYHLSNVLWHLVGTLMVFCFMKVFLGSFLPAFFSALFFAVHPIHVESVAWLSSRKDVLSLAFFMASFSLFAVMREKKGPFWPKGALLYSGSLFTFLLSMLSKGVGLTLPLLLPLYDLSKGHDLGKRPWRKTLFYIPYFFIPFGFYLFYLSLPHVKGTFKPYHGGSLLATMLTMSVVVIRYIKLLFFPMGLNPTYAVKPYKSIMEAEAILSLSFLFIVLFMSVKGMRRRSKEAFFVLWFFITLLPYSNLLPISTLMADRYLHLPSMGFCGLMALLIERALRLQRHGWQRRGILALFYLIILLFSLLTTRQNTFWRSSETLWASTISTSPFSAVAHLGLGVTYAEKGQYQQAMEELNKALLIDPTYTKALYQLGMVYLELGMEAKAQQAFEQCLSQEPNFLPAYISLAMLLKTQGREKEAQALWEKAEKIDPALAQAKQPWGVEAEP